MKKLILGATGAIGSSLAKKIVDQGDKVGNFVIENLDLTQNIISKK